MSMTNIWRSRVTQMVLNAGSALFLHGAVDPRPPDLLNVAHNGQGSSAVGRRELQSAAASSYRKRSWFQGAYRRRRRRPQVVCMCQADINDTQDASALPILTPSRTGGLPQYPDASRHLLR
ncbi:hypothetical protein VTI74DRAFT_4798 [Chaetomium olivicolor]